MQTFLPYPNFGQCAAVLDKLRLGKQRVEAFQVLRALTDPTYGWQNHPAVRMWTGCEQALLDYGLAIVGGWRALGFKDSMGQRMLELAKASRLGTQTPAWLGDEALHQSHRSNLLRKLPEHYRQFWPLESAELPYVWPTKLVKE